MSPQYRVTTAILQEKERTCDDYHYTCICEKGGTLRDFFSPSYKLFQFQCHIWYSLSEDTKREKKDAKLLTND